MTTPDAIRAEAARLRDLFAARGAQIVTPDILQPADTLLDIYGEDIRARAYVTADPLRGEMMLRPDFTVPIVQTHMETADRAGAEPARYAYAGKVFRKQETDAARPVEYIQAGYEVFGGADPAAADAEVFAVIADGLAGLPVRAVTGDMGVLTAAIGGLTTSAARKAALLRHIWRPIRFRALLDRFAGRTPPPAGREALVAQADALGQAGPEIGLRGRAEIAERIERLRDDMATPPIPEPEIALIDRLLSLRAPLPEALDALRAARDQMPALAPAVAAGDARMAALAALGAEPSAILFEGAFGRTTLEYYDGFVFGFLAAQGGTAVATGGRYDALTRVLGDGRDVPAVGGVIRPAMALALKGDGA